MATSAHKTRLLLGDFSLSSKVNKVSMPWAAEMLDVTTLGDAEKNYISGTDSSTFSMSGFYDTATHTDLTSWSTSENPLTLFPFGDAVGAQCAIQSALRATFEPGVSVSGVVSFDLGAQTTGQTDFGICLHALGAETADGNGTTIDNAASTANGAIGSLHVTAFSGFSGIVVDIRHSSDNFVSNDNSLIAFTSVAGVTGELKAATGTVQRYVRVVWTKTGSGSATFAVGFSRR